MHVGMAMALQNLGREVSDAQAWAEELRLAEQAEPLGFASVWATEHHFTDYTLCPDPLQVLTWLAGRTRDIELGTMVVVLPWHNPVRVAESVAVLDILSGGRLVLGIGRGLGRIEFDGLGVPMEESRRRFTEAAEMILRGLEDGHVEYDGEIFHQARRDIRPAPVRTFKGRTYAAAVSPESMRIMAELGVGVLLIPQKPWRAVESDLEAYRSIYREVNGVAAPPTTLAGWVFCDPDAERARELARRYIGTYYESVLAHYELEGRHFETTQGYEYYARMADRISSEGAESAVDFFVDLHVWGTPEQCVQKVLDIRRRVDCDRFLGVFRYGGMPIDEAERNLHLFAREVMPALQAVDTGAEAA